MAVDRIAIQCESCGGKFKAKSIVAGKIVKCAACGSAINVPNLPPIGNEDFNIDAMLGIDGPSEVQAATDLNQSIEQEPTAVSTLEKARSLKEKQFSINRAKEDYREFAALRFLAWLCKVAAWGLAILYSIQFVGSLVVAVFFSPDESTIVNIIGTMVAQLLLFVSTGFVILTLLVYAEIIMLALQIERNTYQAATRQSYRD